MTVSLITRRVSYLFVGSSADADWVLIKYIVAIVGLPKSSKIVIEVELVNVFGSDGLKVYPSANAARSVTTSAAAGTFTPNEILLVACGSPEVTGSCNGRAESRSFAVTEPSSFTG